jgi:hypothetical protein
VLYFAKMIKNFINEIGLSLYMYFFPSVWRVGYAVAQLVEALRNNPEGRGFDSQWNFSVT